MEDKLHDLVDKLKHAHREQLVSVILYGSAAAGDHNEHFSDINVLCVLERVTPAALADSAGNVLGQVDQELAMNVSNVASTCNQLRMDLAATDADVLQTRVHFDKEVAGFDSRDGMRPRTHDALCATGTLLRKQATPDALTQALNNVVTRLAAPPPQ